MNVTLRRTLKDILESTRNPLRPKDILARMSNHQEVDASIREKVYGILSYEARKPNGLVVRTDEGYESRDRVEHRLRRRVKSRLASQGFRLSKGKLKSPDLDSKEKIRELHSAARIEKYEEHRQFLDAKEEKLLGYFADGEDVDIEGLWPRIEVVEAGTLASDLFRYATLLWSVPVSQGFGRRVRFLVWDDNTDRLLGLFALGDPVFNLSCRDEWIGWTHEHRAERLYNVMDIFILGAVPPYNILLGGKLVAMIAASDEVRKVVEEKYAGRKTIIAGKRKDPRLALLTTGSALGKSALYDRIRYEGRVLFQRIGESKGWGHFHLNNGLFEDLIQYLRLTAGRDAAGHEFGDGPNWKIRSARSALEHLGLGGELLRHGIRREIWGIPLAVNFDEFLRGETDTLESYEIPFDDIAGFWKERWLRGRAGRKPEYVRHRRQAVSQAIHSAKNHGQREVGSVDR